MVVLFRVELTSGDVAGFEVAPDGVLYPKNRPMEKTGFKLVGTAIEYTPRDILVGWWQRMKHEGTLCHPIEQILSQAKGYCDNVLWTRDERLAQFVSEGCKVAKQQTSSGRWSF